MKVVRSVILLAAVAHAKRDAQSEVAENDAAQKEADVWEDLLARRELQSLVPPTRAPVGTTIDTAAPTTTGGVGELPTAILPIAPSAAPVVGALPTAAAPSAFPVSGPVPTATPGTVTSTPVVATPTLDTEPPQPLFGVIN